MPANRGFKVTLRQVIVTSQRRPPKREVNDRAAIAETAVRVRNSNWVVLLCACVSVFIHNSDMAA